MPARRSRKAAPSSAGLEPREVVSDPPPGALDRAQEAAEAAAGRVLCRYRDPWGGAPLLLAALPLASVAPTPFQRDVSAPHARRLAQGIRGAGLFLDPIVAVLAPDAPGTVRFWTPNGLHRLTALRDLGARAVLALVSPDPSLAYRILALNTEKAHNLRERALEALRMARALADLEPGRPEASFALELEEGALVTLGWAYEARPRFAGSAWAPDLESLLAHMERAAERFDVAQVRESQVARGAGGPPAV